MSQGEPLPSPRAFVLFGPLGTGKTSTLVEAIATTLNVLVYAPSNAAAS
jgi:tRNA A37 threonylcarbamoyladenosine biosynthesis protein TsaE